jgi:uncharacterized radical SAM superfamily Fe-S cluster-containing enzyme
MDTERVKLELYEHKDENLDGVLFSGSGLEPTIRPDIIELLSYADKLGYKHIWLHSNGRMFCYPKFTKKLLKVVVIMYRLGYMLITQSFTTK